ncbi:hypothetical protein [Filimonas effusa]|uniref:DUF3805 domain-containing protein n=1 Tax=Filimonas effusa TaxID=2508721 RepID=A0A4Q1D9H0_9BACT|nr:hypothetical protein [Filimonas effusa]RXK85870.1 hypothetical protein ESB13_03405 [Filimonas effusa]
MLRSTICCLLLLFTTCTINAQDSVPVLKGWRVTQNNGTYEYTPNTAVKAEFSYTILPLTAGDDQPLGDWLAEQAVKELAVAGWTVLPGMEAQRGNTESFITWSSVAEDKQSRRMAVSFMAYRKDSATIRYGKLMAGAHGTNQDYLNAAIQHFIDLSRKEGMVPDDRIKNTRKKKKRH